MGAKTEGGKTLRFESLGELKELQLKALTADDAGKRISLPGGLSGKVRTSTKGVAVDFQARFRGEDGKPRDKRLGSWPKLRLAEIFAAFRALSGDVAKGIDPIEQARREREAAEAAALEAEALRVSAEREAAALAARMTFAELFERWHKMQLAGRKDGGAEIRRAFEKDVLPTLGGMYADEVTRQHIARVLNDIVERGARRMANRTLSDLRQCFGFAIGAGLLDNDPTSHLKKAAFGGKEVERDRVLDESELRILLQSALPACNLSGKAKAAVRVMLATAARVGELLRAEREHFNLTERTWLIPVENSKNGLAHTIYLSDFACKALGDLLAIYDNPVWLFPDRTGKTHVCVKTLTKQIGDRQTDSPMTGRSSNTQALKLSGGKWTPHDLRRTAATLMGELGVMPHVIELCLNHKEENRVQRTYQRQRMEAEQREAFNLLGERLELLANNVASNVTTIKRA